MRKLRFFDMYKKYFESHAGEINKKFECKTKNGYVYEYIEEFICTKCPYSPRPSSMDCRSTAAEEYKTHNKSEKLKEILK